MLQCGLQAGCCGDGTVLGGPREAVMGQGCCGGTEDAAVALRML